MRSFWCKYVSWASLYLSNFRGQCWELSPESLTPVWVHYSLSSSSKQLLTKCWKSLLYLWVCILGGQWQELPLMHFLWFCIMSYSAPHMVDAVLVVVAWCYDCLAKCTKCCTKIHIVTIWWSERNKCRSTAGLNAPVKNIILLMFANLSLYFWANDTKCQKNLSNLKFSNGISVILDY